MYDKINLMQPKSIVSTQKVVEPMDSMAAKSWYALGSLLDVQGDYDEARQAYIRAKDLDQLRFRATEYVNNIIREESTLTGATLVDTQQELRQNSNENIIDPDLMLEHLHPNLEGYFNLADAFYEAIYESQIHAAPKSYVPEEIARSEVLFTEVDSIFGELRLQKLLGSWPFQPIDVITDIKPDTMTTKSRAEELARALDQGELQWFAATDQLRSYYVSKGHYHRALRASLALLQEFPYLPLPYAYAGDVLVAQGRLDEAVEYYGAANDLEESAMIHFNLGLIYQRKRELELAEEHLKRAIAMDSNVPEFQLQLARNHILMGDLVNAQIAVDALLELAPEHESGHALQE